ncbi:MAG: hypothetical protein M3Q42_11810 [Pseudomonadota bacterium]|nr:hypothetical protein [Pseudomonadota bacterium]
MIDHAELVALLLASTAKWQELTGTATYLLALAYIHQFQEDEDADAPVRPRAIVQQTERSRRIVGTGTWAGEGACLLSLELEYTEPTPLAPATTGGQQTWFMLQVNTLEEQMRAISASRVNAPGKTHSHLQIRDIAWSVEPFLIPIADREDEGDDATSRKPCWAVQFRITY